MSVVVVATVVVVSILCSSLGGGGGDGSVDVVSASTIGVLVFVVMVEIGWIPPVTDDGVVIPPVPSKE